MDQSQPRVTSAEPAHLAYRPDIDGMRAFGVLLVLGYHLFPEYLPGGFVGVDIFFVISGYLITSIVVSSSRDGTFSFVGFYGARIRRIFPAVLLVLIASAIAGWALLLPRDFGELGYYEAAAAAFLSNIALWRKVGYFDAIAILKPLLHLWSLAIEEQFYLFWPLVILAFRRRQTLLLAVLIAVTLISFCLGIVLMSGLRENAFYNPLSRLWELSIGGCWAAYLAGPADRRRAVVEAAATFLTVAGTILIGTAVCLLGPKSPFPGWLALPPALGTLLLISAGGKSLFGRILSMRPLVALGKISYPTYLWHWPLLYYAAYIFGEMPPAELRLMLAVASIGLAAVTYRVVERPTRSIRPATAALVLIPVMAAVGLAGWTVHEHEGFPERFPAEVREVIDFQNYAFQSDARLSTCWLANQTFEAFAPYCFPREGQSRSIILWGDSFAARLYPGLRAVLEQSLDVAQLTTSACRPSVRLGDETCQETNRRVIEVIGKVPPQPVLLFANWHGDWTVGTGEAWVDLRDTLRALAGVGAGEVIVIGPMPTWRPELPLQMFRFWQQERRLPTRLVPARETRPTDLAMRNLVQSEGGTYISLVDRLCTAAGCPVSVPGTPETLISWDYGHLTTAGSIFVAERIRSELPLN